MCMDLVTQVMEMDVRIVINDKLFNQLININSRMKLKNTINEGFIHLDLSN